MAQAKTYDIDTIRRDFPILHQQVHNQPLIYLDNAATTQKPKPVIDKVNEIYSLKNSNIHRGVHYLSTQLTEAYEEAREKVREFINAGNTHEIIFTGGTTHSINAIAYSFGEKYVQAGDEIIIAELEHHANIVPWQVLCERKDARLKVIPINDRGEIIMEAYEKMISGKTKIVAINHISNTLGTINDVKKIINLAHKQDIPVLVDGAQSVQHQTIDVQELDCDFFAFSGHKIYGPNGTGVLYGKEKWLEDLPPYQTGGEMIHKVSFEHTTYTSPPLKFEAGTSNYVGAIGMAEALKYLQKIGLDEIAAHEKGLLDYATSRLEEIPGLTIYGTASKKISVISFLIENIHHYDTGMVLDKMGIAVRTGHHCTEPLMNHFNVEGTVRCSFAMYNTKDEIDHLYRALIKVNEMFG
ncbi:MAG: cysteine desulfurase [Bacteroidales bacterium]|nr:cysteine desulfurase [Bacteroidales bacterium]